MTQVLVKTLAHAQGLPLPAYESLDAAGVDLLAAVEKSVSLSPGQRYLIPTGISIALPVGFEAQVRPRSGLALKHGLTVLNSPGTIDADYRGEIGVILINLGQETVLIERGMRVAQMIISPVARLEWQRVDILPETDRSHAGFGSTGS